MLKVQRTANRPNECEEIMTSILYINSFDFNYNGYEKYIHPCYNSSFFVMQRSQNRVRPFSNFNVT